MVSPYVDRAMGRVAFLEGRPLDPSASVFWKDGYMMAAEESPCAVVPQYLKALEQREEAPTTYS